MIQALFAEASPAATVGVVALATAAAEFLALIFAVLAFAYGRTFGRIHDVLGGVAAVLSAGLAMLLFTEQRAFNTQIAPLAFGIAVLGGFVAAFGSVLAATEAASWFLAQLFAAAGNGLIGIWLIALSVTAQAAHTLPNRVVNLGMFAGAVMALGIAAIPGILMGAETEDRAPWISRYVGRAGELGCLLLYPLWCLWLGLSRM